MRVFKKFSEAWAVVQSALSGCKLKLKICKSQWILTQKMHDYCRVTVGNFTKEKIFKKVGNNIQVMLPCLVILRIF